MPSVSPSIRQYVCPSCRHRRFASTSARAPEVYDVVCVGGGPAGLALLSALRASPITSNLKIALIESQDLGKAKAWSLPAHEYSNRASSLTPASVSFVKKTGAWKYVDQDRVQRYHEMKVWDGQTGSRVTFDWLNNGSSSSSSSQALLSRDQSARPVATMTENANLVRALLLHLEALRDGADVSVFSNTTVKAIENGRVYSEGPDLTAWPVLTLSPSSPSSNPSQIAARLLVGADGINSPVRSYAGISTHGWDYNRHGVVATLALDESSAASGVKTAYQRFLPSLGGPVALLPLPGQYASLVWSTTVENATYLKSLPPAAFVAMVNAAFRLDMPDLKYMMSLDAQAQTSPDVGAATAAAAAQSAHGSELAWRLSVQKQSGSRPPPATPPLVTGVQARSVASFPLRFRHATTYIAPRVALVGDAAHVVHPLAGQGLNLGLGDVASLAATIEYAVRHGMDLGDLLSLERYFGDRYMPNAAVAGVCDLLHRLYTTPGWGPVACGRSLGVELVDRLPLLKRFLMTQAEG